jgi:subtilisin family serine protease
MDIGALHAQGIDGRGVKIAVLDDGILMTHPDLANVVSGYNFANRTTSLHTGNNTHGTHVAGTVGSTGHANSLGVAPGATMYNGMVFPRGQSGAPQTAIVAALEIFSGFGIGGMGVPGVNQQWSNFPGLQELVNNGTLGKVDVINMSLGNQAETEYGNGSWERNNAVLAGVVLANSAGNGAHPSGNTTHRSNYSVGSGGTMLSISVAATQYGGDATWFYPQATINGLPFTLFIENNDGKSSGFYGHQPRSTSSVVQHRIRSRQPRMVGASLRKHYLSQTAHRTCTRSGL